MQETAGASDVSKKVMTRSRMRMKLDMLTMIERREKKTKTETERREYLQDYRDEC